MAVKARPSTQVSDVSRTFGDTRNGWIVAEPGDGGAPALLRPGGGRPIVERSTLAMPYQTSNTLDARCTAALLVRMAERHYALPLASVERVVPMAQILSLPDTG